MKIRIKKNQDLGEFSPASSGKLAIERAKQASISAECVLYRLCGKTIEITDRPYAKSFCIENLGIYEVKRIPVFFNLCVNFSGELWIEESYRSQVDYKVLQDRIELKKEMIARLEFVLEDNQIPRTFEIDPNFENTKIRTKTLKAINNQPDDHFAFIMEDLDSRDYWLGL